MSVVELNEFRDKRRLEYKRIEAGLALEERIDLNLFIDDVELSALNFISMYTGHKPKNHGVTFIRYLTSSIDLCTTLYGQGDMPIEKNYNWDIQQPISKKYIYSVNIYDSEFFRDTIRNFPDNFQTHQDVIKHSINIYIQAFLDEFNGDKTMNVRFPINKEMARKKALETGQELVLETISSHNLEPESYLSFVGVGGKELDSFPILYYK